MSKYRVDLESMPWEIPMDGLRFKAHRQADTQLRLVEYSRDMEPHWCEKGHIGYILEGQFEIRFTGEATVFKPGDGIFIPPGREHRHMGKVLTDTVRVIFVEDA